VALVFAFKKLRRKKNMAKYVCPCGYEYDPKKGDPDSGIAPGTACMRN
jgi:hypothetical protein